MLLGPEVSIQMSKQMSKMFESANLALGAKIYLPVILRYERHCFNIINIVSPSAIGRLRVCLDHKINIKKILKKY